MATSTDSQRSELVQLLQQEVECTRNLMQSLEIENEALSERRTSLLEEVIQDKMESIKQLEIIGHKRMALIESFASKAASNDPFFDSSTDPLNNDDSQLAGLWKELMLLAEKCQKQNRINGSIVEIGYKQSSHALDILRGTQSKSDLYDNTGQATRGTSSKPITRA